MECKDNKCAVHGGIRTRGRKFTGIVISASAQKTATIEWKRKHYIPKYERYETRITRVKAHNPDCIDAEKGDIVEIAECRKLSKTKSFVILRKLSKERLFAEKEALKEEAKTKKKEKVEKDESS